MNFVRNAESDGPISDALPCHTQIDYEDKDWRKTQYPDADLCAGALIFAKNSFKIPRDPARAEAVNAVERSDTIFRYAYEFVIHHRGVLDDVQKLVKGLVEGVPDGIKNGRKGKAASRKDSKRKEPTTHE